MFVATGACARPMPEDSGDRAPHAAAASQLGGVDATALLLAGDMVEPLTLQLAPDTWRAMQEDLEAVLAEPRADAPDVPDPVSRRPATFEGAFSFRGERWEHVGVRFKGNSTLAAAAHLGSSKLPFRLDLDALADSWPETRGRRFYGIEQLSLSNAARDPTQVRAWLAGRWMRAFGVPAPRGRFVAVSLDLLGKPTRYLGLYTLAEVPGDLRVRELSGGGTLYEADGPGATLESADALQDSLHAELPGSDGADVRAAVAVLTGPRADGSAWRARMSGAWDVDGAVRWLAANTLLVNWDTYGVAAHNFYLHGDAAGRVTLLPWDLDEAMRPHPAAPSLNLAEVGPRWPLIRRLLDDPGWNQAYRQAVVAFADGPLARADTDILEACAATRPWVAAEAPEDSFTTPDAHSEGCAELRAHVAGRRALAEPLRGR